MYKAILFDFDGTLADTAPGIVLTMQETFRELGLTVPTPDAIRQTIGLPLEDAVQLFGAESKAAVAVYQRLFPACELTHISIFPHVKETLDTLKAQGIRMAICTSRNVESLLSILEKHGIGGYFEAYITGSDRLPAKPAPDMVYAVCQHMEVACDETVLMVGDTTFDIEMGNAAHCTTCAVTYGNHTEQQLQAAHPTHTIHRFDDLINLL